MREFHRPVEPRYDLSSDEINSRVTEFAYESRDRFTATDRRIICCEADGNMQDVARTIERAVFEESFGNDSAEMQKIYGPYEAASKFFLSIDKETLQPVGVLRAIANSDAGLMTFNTLPSEATVLGPDELQEVCGIETLDACWDIGTVAVPSEYRKQGAGISVQLYRSMYLSAMQHDIKHLVAIIDKSPLDTMTTFLGIPFEHIPGTVPFEYEGSSESAAVHGYVPEFYDKMRQKLTTPEGQVAFEYLMDLVEGRGDDAIFLDSGKGGAV